MKKNEFKSKFSREEITMKGLEIVSFAGEARSNLLEALNAAKDNDFKKADELVKIAKDKITLAHRAQTEMLSLEAAGDYSDMTLIMVHGQDHLMTTILLNDVIDALIDVYRK